MRLERRHFLNGLAAIGSLGLLRASLPVASAWAAAPKDRDEQSFEYRGKRVKIHETDHEIHVTVNDRLQHHIMKAEARRYLSHLYPFRDYEDAPALVRSLINGEADGAFKL